MNPFQAVPNATVNIDVSSSSQAIKVSERQTAQIRVMNNGSATAWIAFGDSTITTAVTTGAPVGPGVTEVFTVQKTDGAPIYASARAAGSTGKIYFTPGLGI